MGWDLSKLQPQLQQRITDELHRQSRTKAATSPIHPELPLQEDCARKEEGHAPAVRPKLERRDHAGALGPRQKKEGDSRCFLVRVTSFRRRLIDTDNLCEKFVVDCCRYAGLIPDDRPGQTEIEVRQQKVGKEDIERTEVEIYQL